MSDASAINAADLGLGPEDDIRPICDSVSEVLTDRCDGRALHDHIDGRSDLAAELEVHASDLGWLAIGLPDEFGGFGLGMAGLALLHRELGRACAPGSFIPASIAAQAMAAGGNDQAHQVWLPGILTGETRVAIPAELGRTSDSGLMTMLGRIDANIAVLPAAEGELAVVDLTDRLKQPLDYWDRTRSLFTVNLADVTPLATLNDTEGGFFRAFAIAVAADCAGLMRSLADKTVNYLKERQQFGRPVGSFQAIKHRAVDLYAKIGIAEHVLAQAIEADSRREVSATMWAALAKAATSEAAAFVASDSVQLHGGIGFTWEFDVHLYLKRARLNEMLVGGQSAMRDLAADLLARETAMGRTTLELSAL